MCVYIYIYFTSSIVTPILDYTFSFSIQLARKRRKQTTKSSVFPACVDSITEVGEKRKSDILVVGFHFLCLFIEVEKLVKYLEAKYGQPKKRRRLRQSLSPAASSPCELKWDK